jgi:WD40 repeat protein
VGIVLAAATIAILYVRGVTSERDRADTARAEAERERRSAALERDRAQLSEATMWLEKDPTHARDLLHAIRQRDPQQALLLTQAEARSASGVFHLDSRVQTMLATGDPLDVAVVTVNGTFVRLNPDAGTLRIDDHDVTGPLLYHDGKWCYVRELIDTNSTTTAGCGTVAAIGNLLRRPNGHLTWSDGSLYALETGDLYRIDSTRTVRVGRRIRGFVGSDTLSMTCSEDGTLQVTRAGKLIMSSACASNNSLLPMAARAEHYVALQSPTALISDRGTVTLPFAVKGEYEVALGDDGLIALADVSGDAWIVRPGSLRAESVARRSAHPMSIAADGSLVAFGYSDGVVIVIDTSTDLHWEFVGHDAAVLQIVIDAAHRRIVSGAGDELRVWPLHLPAISVVGILPCSPFHIVAIKGSGSFATDCNDGRALVWTPGKAQIRTLHTHQDLSFGIVSYQGAVCTGGWDGRVLCTPAGGGETTEMLAAGNRIKSLVACDDKGLFATTEGGAVWSLDGGARVLYKHPVTSHRLDVDDQCTRLVSGAYDGSLIVYDLIHGKLDSELLHAHAGQISSVAILRDNIFTTGLDSSIRRWNIGASLERSEDIQMPSPIKKLRVSPSGWVAGAGDRTIALHSTISQSEMFLAPRHTIADIAISPTGRYVAIADLDEIIVVDRERDRIATTYRPTSDIGCLQFTAPTTILACDVSAIVSLSLEMLDFAPMGFPESDASAERSRTAQVSRQQRNEPW